VHPNSLQTLLVNLLVGAFGETIARFETTTEFLGKPNRVYLSASMIDRRHSREQRTAPHNATVANVRILLAEPLSIFQRCWKDPLVHEVLQHSLDILHVFGRKEPFPLPDRHPESTCISAMLTSSPIKADALESVIFGYPLAGPTRSSRSFNYHTEIEINIKIFTFHPSWPKFVIFQD
jgi:hypothetical protein